MKAFLYARVSTGEQSEGMQLREMQEFATRRGASVQLIVPKPLKFARAQVCVSHGMPNVGMSQIGLNDAQILPALRKIIAARVAEHVRMHIQAAEARAHGQAFHHQLHPASRELPTALRSKNEIGGRRTVAFELTQGSNLHPAQRMVAGEATLFTSHVEDTALQVEIRPDCPQRFDYPQPVCPHRQQERMVSHPIAILAGRFQQLFHFVWNQVLARSLPTARPRDDCSL